MKVEFFVWKTGCLGVQKFIFKIWEIESSWLIFDNSDNNNNNNSQDVYDSIGTISSFTENGRVVYPSFLQQYARYFLDLTVT